jgi:hypothetical protein
VPKADGTLRQHEQAITNALFAIITELQFVGNQFRPSKAMVGLLHERRGSVVRANGKKRFIQMIHIPQAQNLTRWLKADHRFEESPIYCRSKGRRFRVKEEYL